MYIFCAIYRLVTPNGGLVRESPQDGLIISLMIYNKLPRIFESVSLQTSHPKKIMFRHDQFKFNIYKTNKPPNTNGIVAQNILA